MFTEMNFAHDFPLIWDKLEKAQTLLKRVENAAKEVGLHINSSKTEYMVDNLWQHGDITTLYNSKLKQMDDFQYLGSWIDQT